MLVETVTLSLMFTEHIIKKSCVLINTSTAKPIHSKQLNVWLKVISFIFISLFQKYSYKKKMILWLFTCSRVDVSYCVVIACGEFLPVLIYLDQMSLTWSCLNFAMIDDKINARDQKGGLLKGSFIALYRNSILCFLITYDTFFALTWVHSKRQIYLLPSGRGHDCLDWDPGPVRWLWSPNSYGKPSPFD